MAVYEFKYLHATVEHALSIPIPENVQLVFRNRDLAVYFVDLPASVWAAVAIRDDDPYQNTLETFPSATLRKEWLDGILEPAAADRPPGVAASLGR